MKLNKTKLKNNRH